MPPAGKTFSDSLTAWALRWHVLAAGIWLLMMPGGFPWNHPRFWANRGLPILLVALWLAVIVVTWRRGLGPIRAVRCAIPVGWTAALVVGIWLFPYSARRFAPPVLLATALFWWLALGRGRWRAFGHWPAALLSVAAIALGAVVPLTQRAPDADTRPHSNDTDDDAKPETQLANANSPLWLGPFMSVDVFDPHVLIAPPSTGPRRTREQVNLFISPRLTFISTSPDRCWTIFAQRPHWTRRVLQLRDVVHKDRTVDLRYSGNHDARLKAHLDRHWKFATIEAISTLKQDSYSHLNSFCQVSIGGHHNLQLVFSPCPNQRIEVLESEYPVGKPARMAYLDTAGVFHVVEARSGEKGPFRELARGPLGATEPLTITLVDDGHQVCHLTFDDWAAQAGRQLSPTAGWGLPVNAIEFSETRLNGANIWMTLAGTSVGRGWDSVGHRAGTYRNRIRVDW